jgi:tRNA threonylcarbamoyladenosine biosynthesis protein TsaE
MMEPDPKIQNSKLNIQHCVTSRSAAQTRAWGKKLGRLLTGGEIIGLTGELGSGKTCFTRGLAEGAGVGKEAWIRSPTFTLINEYDGRRPMYHIDLYRIENSAAMEELNLREYLFSGGISVIEWFEHLPREEADEWLQIDFEHAGLSERRLTFTAHGQLYEELLKGLKV